MRSLRPHALGACTLFLIACGSDDGAPASSNDTTAAGDGASTDADDMVGDSGADATPEAVVPTEPCVVTVTSTTPWCDLPDVVRYTFDLSGKIVESHFSGCVADEPVRRNVFVYNARGDVTSIGTEQSDDGAEWTTTYRYTWTYDSQGRLTGYEMSSVFEEPESFAMSWNENGTLRELVGEAGDLSVRRSAQYSGGQLERLDTFEDEGDEPDWSMRFSYARPEARQVCTSAEPRPFEETPCAAWEAPVRTEFIVGGEVVSTLSYTLTDDGRMVDETRVGASGTLRRTFDGEERLVDWELSDTQGKLLERQHNIYDGDKRTVEHDDDGDGEVDFTTQDVRSYGPGCRGDERDPYDEIERVEVILW